jgi:hypothetical protein
VLGRGTAVHGAGDTTVDERGRCKLNAVSSPAVHYTGAGTAVRGVHIVSGLRGLPWWQQGCWQARRFRVVRCFRTLLLPLESPQQCISASCKCDGVCTRHAQGSRWSQAALGSHQIQILLTCSGSCARTEQVQYDEGGMLSADADTNTKTKLRTSTPSRMPLSITQQCRL